MNDNWIAQAMRLHVDGSSQSELTRSDLGAAARNRPSIEAAVIEAGRAAQKQTWTPTKFQATSGLCGAQGTKARAYDPAASRRCPGG
jgi:hypothetical protein